MYFEPRNLEVFCVRSDGLGPWELGRGDARRARVWGAVALFLLLSGCAKPPPPASPVRVVTADDATTCASRRANGAEPLVDDFEVGPGQILGNEGRGGWWFGFDDGTKGKLHREEIEADGTEGKSRVLHVASSGFLNWGAGFGVGLHAETDANQGCAYDASAYSGVRIRARGRGRLRLQLADGRTTPTEQGGTCTRAGTKCFDRPGVALNLEEQWKTYEFPFCTFFPQGWSGATETVDPAKLFSLQFVAGPREDLEAWLDDLAFYRSTEGAPAPRCGPACPLDAAPATARIEPRFSTATLTKELTVHTFEQTTRSCGALTRRYLSFVPSALGPRSSAPVLIMLHGSESNAESARSFMAHDRFDTLATRDGFIVVYGNAAPGSYTSPNTHFPNTGAWRQEFFDDGQVDDLDYLERVLGDLVARGVIEGSNAVYLAGISNGGGMALEAARRHPLRFRGIAAMMPYAGEHPKPVPDLTPTKLRRVLIAYSINDPGMTERYHETLAPLPALWANGLGIPKAAIVAPRQTLLPDVVVEGEGYHGGSAVALATRNSRVTQFDMEGPDADRRVRVLVLDRAGHFWPNSIQDTEDWALNRWGFRNQDFDAADMVWEYLRK